MKTLFFAVVWILAMPFVGNAQLKLLKDINPGATQDVPGTPHSFTTVGGTTFFIQTYDGQPQLYRSTGSGAEAVANGWHAKSLTSFNGKLYFFGALTGQRVTLWSVTESSTEALSSVVFHFTGADTLLVHEGSMYASLHGDLENPADITHAIWKTDGTQVGASQAMWFKSLNAGAGVRHLTSVGNKLYFTFGDNAVGEKIWTSDGTEVGTAMLDFLPGPIIAVDTYKNFVVGNSNLVYFIAGNQLWRTDGTIPNTVKVFEGNQAAQVPIEPTLFKSKIFFATWDYLWSTDGTLASTVQIKKVYPNSGLPYIPHSLIVYHDSLFFAGPHPIGGSDLWRSNGTELGTVRSNFLVGTGPGADIVIFKDSLYFSTFTERFLAKFNGEDRAKVIFNTGSPPHVTGRLHATATRLYFAAKQDAEQGSEPWVSEGTKSTTIKLKDIGHKGYGSVDDGTFHQGFELNGMFYFGAKEEYWSQLWMTDGTAEGTTKIKDIAPVSLGPGLSKFTRAGSTVYFAAQQVSGLDVVYKELWKTDGTTGGTMLVKEMPVHEIFILNDKVFVLSEGNLFKTDGTGPGTVEVAPEADAAFSGPVNVLGNVAYFRGEGAPGQFSIWQTDGTEAGTEQIDSPLESLEFGVVAGNKFYYYTASNKVWVTTGDDHTLLHDFGPTTIDGLNAVGDKLLISVGDETWVSNGTEVGTVLLADGRSTLANRNEQENSHVLDSKFYMNFSSNVDPTGAELWKTDGTTPGTEIVKNIGPDLEPDNLYNGSAPSHITAYENRVYFVAGPNGDLYTTSGTEQSTEKIVTRSDVWIQQIYPFRNHLLISGLSVDLGPEMYVYDLDPLKQDQTIDFTSTTTFTYGDQSFELTGSSTSELPVTYTSSNEAVLSIDGNSVEIVGAGIATITAHQDGNGHYNPAEDVAVEITVNKRVSTIEFSPVADQLVDGDDIELVATTNSDAELVFSTTSTTVTIDGNIATIVGAGTTTITASVPDDGNNTGASEEVTFCIKPLAPVVILSVNNVVTSLSTTNTWYKDGVLIEGQTGQQITAAEEGVYTATTTVGGCTSELSEPLTFVVNGIEDALRSTTISPNPAKDFVDVTWSGSEDVSLELMSSVGQSLGNSLFSKVSQNTYRGDVSSLSSGVYILRMRTSGSTQVRKVIVSH